MVFNLLVFENRILLLEKMPSTLDYVTIALFSVAVLSRNISIDVLVYLR